jgi:CheY-like chemotaxis protein/anti-sigma regulatory factor (Ser/Thr protein kinase)
MEVEESYFRLHPLTDMVAQGLEVLSETKKIDLKVGIDVEVPEVLWGDALCLSQVLINLLRNAIQHAPEGSTVSLRIDLEEKMTYGPRLRFVIRDEGPGFPEEMLAALGQPFRSGKPADQGWGLGLFMVYRWVEVMDGTLQIENLAEKGSEVTIRLPFGRNRRREDIPEGAEEEMAFSMLVVEDNELSREALHSVLAKNFSTARIYTAGTVEEVMQLIQEHPRISLALIDLYLHGQQDGQRVAERIKTLSPECTIIAMSAMPMLSVNPPFSHYLAKPIRPPELVTAIGRFMTAPVNG